MEGNIAYKIRRSRRAQRLRLAVFCDGNIVVTSPHHVSQSIIEDFISAKKKWILEKLQFYKNIDTTSIRPFSKKDYIINKDKALLLVKSRVELYNKIYNFSFKNIVIRNQKTRWGSCSKKGNLNFNYKIMFLPQKYQDYIIVHEICHLKEFNHSRNFWALVSRALPNYLEIRKELRRQELLYR